MNICSFQHDEIVHNSRACPLCELADAKDKIESDRDDVKRELDKAMEGNAILDEENVRLERRVDELEGRLAQAEK